MELGLAGQAPAAPAREGARLGQAHVDRPVRHLIERQPVEERAIDPGPVHQLPHRRVLDAVVTAPHPVLVGPQVGAPVAPVLDEGLELAIGHRGGVHAEGGHVHLEGGELVVPAEGQLVEAGAEGRRARRDLDRAGGAAGPEHVGRQPGRSHLALERQALQHVQHCLLMHELVLDHHAEDAALPGHQVRVRARGHRVHRSQQRRAHAIAIGDDLGHRGPAVRHLGMVVALRRIVHVGVDPAREQLVEGRVERRPLQHATAHVVPGEGGQVPEVEDERVAQRDRLGEPALWREDLEDPIGARPRVGQPVRDRLDHVTPFGPGGLLLRIPGAPGGV